MLVPKFTPEMRGDVVNFSLPDTTVRQGTIIEYPVFLQMTGKGANNTCIVNISVPRKRVNLIDALSKPGTLFSCKKPTITFLSESATEKNFSITCSNPLIDTIGILLYLRLEILAGRDTNAEIEVQSFQIGDSLTNFNQIGGSFSFSDPPIVQAKAEGMEMNIPNPFSYSTSFDYFIGKSGNVEFSLFNSQGKLVQQFPTEFKNAGKYTFNLLVDNPMDFSSGVYVIRMKTESGLYHMSMVHKK